MIAEPRVNVIVCKVNFLCVYEGLTPINPPGKFSQELTEFLGVTASGTNLVFETEFKPSLMQGTWAVTAP